MPEAGLKTMSGITATFSRLYVVPLTQLDTASPESTAKLVNI